MLFGEEEVEGEEDFSNEKWEIQMRKEKECSNNCY
jgi:hypothetical protein